MNQLRGCQSENQGDSTGDKADTAHKDQSWHSLEKKGMKYSSDQKERLW